MLDGSLLTPRVNVVLVVLIAFGIVDILYTILYTAPAWTSTRLRQTLPLPRCMISYHALVGRHISPAMGQESLERSEKQSHALATPAKFLDPDEPMKQSNAIMVFF